MAKEAVMHVLEAINSVKSRVGYIEHNAENRHQKYGYANEEAILAKIRPAMIDAGLVIVPEEIVDPRVEVRTKSTSSGGTFNDGFVEFATYKFRMFSKVDGSSISIAVRASGYDSLDKSAYKMNTGALKYALLKVFQIATGDDPEAEDTLTGIATPAETAPAIKEDEPPKQRRRRGSEESEDAAPKSTRTRKPAETEEEEDEAPKSRRARKNEDDEDDAPKSRRKPNEDEEEEETPKSRRKPVESDDEDEAPKSRRRKPEEEEEDEVPKSRRRPKDEDDEEDEPKPRRRAKDEDEEEEPPKKSSAPKKSDAEDLTKYHKISSFEKRIKELAAEKKTAELQTFYTSVMQTFSDATERAEWRQEAGPIVRAALKSTE